MPTRDRLMMRAESTRGRGAMLRSRSSACASKQESLHNASGLAVVLREVVEFDDGCHL